MPQNAQSGAIVAFFSKYTNEEIFDILNYSTIPSSLPHAIGRMLLYGASSNKIAQFLDSLPPFLLAQAISAAKQASQGAKIESSLYHMGNF